MARKKKKFSSAIVYEIWGVLCCTLGFLVLLSLSHNLGEAGVWITSVGVLFLGKGIWILPFVLFFVGGRLFFHYISAWSVVSFVGMMMIFLSIQGLLHLSAVSPELMDQPLAVGGGILGVSASVVFRTLLGDIGATVVLIMGGVVGFLVAFQYSLAQGIAGVIHGGKMILGVLFSVQKSVMPKKSSAKKEKQNHQKTEETKESKKNTVGGTQEGRPFTIRRGGGDTESVERKKTKSSEKNPKENIVSRPEDQDFSSWEKPSLSVLEDGSSAVHVPDHQLHKIGGQIVEKLAHFKVGVQMDSAFVGPTVTQFALQPDETVKLNKITGLKNELALALSAESVRIEAPIPGKNLVGIEIPNAQRSSVLMKEILQSSGFESSSGTLRLCLGKDVSGEPVVEALDEMPHLLIAGSTGSGKSVGMNAFLISMLFENSPSDLRFIMVDPKRVELMPYEGIPHLLTPVITDAGKALSSLRWCVSEMMRRLEEFSSVGARNIAEYNEMMEKKMAEQSEKKEGEEGERREYKKIPKIVIVIDELADLMMREHKKETEAMICRIAQMARAVGMHLVIATQRPSVDVITGLIKANIPTRIAFTVTSAIDSRTILDSIGAEDLLGKGDMLFTSPKLSRPRRIQGIYISGKEIERVVSHLKIKVSDEFFTQDYISLDDAPDSVDIPGIEKVGGQGSGDEMIEEALEIVRSTGKASASLLQRRLSVGYARAARILDEMEEMGYIGPSRGAKPREIYV